MNIMPWEVYRPENVAYIVTFGPEPMQDKHGDEIPVWYLSRCDHDENEIMHTTYFTYDELIKEAEALAANLNVPLTNEASQA